MSSVPTVIPAPPEDLPGLVDAYEQTARAVLALGRDCPPERAADPTPCPGWDVFAQVAHVESVESTSLGEPPPQVDLDERAHVRGEMGRFMEGLIESRRGLTLPELCDRLEDAIARRVEHWRAPGLTLASEEVGLFGTSSVADVIGLRCFDIWTHEQDLRETLDRPGGLDSPAASLSLARVYTALGRSSPAPECRSVRPSSSRSAGRCPADRRCASSRSTAGLGAGSSTTSTTRTPAAC